MSAVYPQKPVKYVRKVIIQRAMPKAMLGQLDTNYFGCLERKAEREKNIIWCIMRDRINE